MTAATLRPEQRDEPMISGGTVAYRVYLGDRWVGWVGDGREWKGWRYGGRRWFACWREGGDEWARWNTGLEHGTRTSALAALVAQIETASA